MICEREIVSFYVKLRSFFFNVLLGREYNFSPACICAGITTGPGPVPHGCLYFFPPTLTTLHNPPPPHTHTHTHTVVANRSIANFTTLAKVNLSLCQRYGQNNWAPPFSPFLAVFKRPLQQGRN